MIEKLTYGNGLPATMDEMYLIEQIREKRAFEDALPPTSDEHSFGLRRRLMEEQEVREWSNREEEIKKIQNECMNLLQSALLEREKDTEEKHAERTKDIKLKKTEIKNRAVAKIHRRRIKVMRKKYKDRSKIEYKIKRREIIEEYSNFGSKVYAPITREGMSLDKMANKFEVQPEALSSYAAISELGNKIIGSKHTEIKIPVHDIKKKYTTELKRNETKHREALNLWQNSIEKEKKFGEISDQKLVKAKDQERVRSDTPEMDKDGLTESQRENRIAYERSILLIQRLIRGRATQNMMYEGKERRLDLIEELRRTEECKQAAEDAIQKGQVETYQEKVLDGFADAVQGKVIATTLDGLSKELVRLKQERKIAFMVKLAEQERRKREAEESGKRQAEEVLREREENLFRSIMKVHQGTVDSYLQGILCNSVDAAAAMRALDEAKIKAKKFNVIVDNLEKKLNNPTTVVKDLVSSFLIPNIQRTRLQKQVELEQKKHIKAAQEIIKKVKNESEIKI